MEDGRFCIKTICDSKEDKGIELPIETREINYKEPENNEEWVVVRYTCPKCRTLNYPHEYRVVKLPFVEANTCKKCGYEKDNTWLDSAGRSELARKRAGLLQTRSDPEKQRLREKILELEKRLAKYEGNDKPQDVVYSEPEKDE